MYRAVVYRQALRIAAKFDGKTHHRCLLAALPLTLWMRQTSKIISLDNDKDHGSSLQHLQEEEVTNFLEENYSLDVLVRKANGGAEFYLPSSSSLENSPSYSLTTAVRAIRRMAEELRRSVENDNLKVAALDNFFDELGFEVLRRGNELLAASELIFTTPNPETKVLLPFSSLRPAPGNILNQTEKNMVLITHPSACLGQESLHASVIAMTSKGKIDDEVLGVVVNKPWTYYDQGTKIEGALLEAVLTPKDLIQFQKRKKDNDVQALLDVSLFQGGPVGTSLMIMYEAGPVVDNEEEYDVRDDVRDEVKDEEEDGDEDDGNEEVGLMLGTFGTMQLRVLEDVADLIALVEKKVVDPRRCKLLVGLCVWNRDQLATELERNVWIRSKLITADEGELVEFALMNQNNVSVSGGREKEAFSSTCWRGAVGQLGEAYEKLAYNVEVEHDVILGHLGHVAEKRLERVSERLSALGLQDDEEGDEGDENEDT